MLCRELYISCVESDWYICYVESDWYISFMLNNNVCCISCWLIYCDWYADWYYAEYWRIMYADWYIIHWRILWKLYVVLLVLIALRLLVQLGILPLSNFSAAASSWSCLRGVFWVCWPENSFLWVLLGENLLTAYFLCKWTYCKSPW